MIDPEARRLYISDDLGIIVFDVDTEKVVGKVPKSPYVPSVGFVHGVALAPELNRGFISHEVPPTAVIFDPKTLAVLSEAKTDLGTDAIVYDPASKRVFTFGWQTYEGVHDATAIDAATGKPLGNIQLSAGPEFAVADGAGHIYVDIEDKSKLDGISTPERSR